MQLTVELLDTEEENSDEPMEAEVRNTTVNLECQGPLASGTIFKPIIHLLFGVFVFFLFTLRIKKKTKHGYYINDVYMFNRSPLNKQAL